MSILKAASAMAASLLALLAAVPVLVLGVPFWLVGSLTARIARSIEPVPHEPGALTNFDPRLGWKPKPNLNASDLSGDFYRLTTDSEGWRGRIPMDQCEIIALGDSFAFGCGMDDATMFAALNPEIRIKGVGYNGYNMVQPLLLLEELGVRLKGKLVVWMIFLGNDLAENILPDMQGYRTPFLGPRDEAGEWEIVTEHLSPEPWTHSSKRRHYRELLAQLCGSNFFSERVYSACDFLVQRGRDAAAGAGADLVVMTIPEKTQLTGEGRAFLERHCEGTFDVDYPDERIEEICRRWNVECVRGKAHLDAGDYMDGDVHWNQRGHRKVNRLLGEIYRNRVSPQARRDPASKPEVGLVRDEPPKAIAGRPAGGPG